MKLLIRWLILFYQKALSPGIHFLGGPGTGCRFEPTCSRYFLEAVETHGVLKGSWMGIKRIGRCNPWGPTGLDPVPKSSKNSTCDCSCHNSSSSELESSIDPSKEPPWNSP